MARPLKDGLAYYPVDVDRYEDDKMIDLANEFGPVGEAIYDRILCFIYRNGYYYKFDSLDKLANKLIRSIGNKWVRDKQVVLQVIPFLAECNLLSSELMQENVLTSVGVQKRYLKATERRQPRIREYDLIGSYISAPENPVNADNNPDNADNNPSNVDDKYTKKSKVKESKEKENVRAGARPPADISKSDFLFEANMDDEVKQAVRQWVTYKEERAEKYATMGLLSLRETVEKLAQEHKGCEIISLINQAMANGYKGIPWDRLDRQHKDVQQSYANQHAYSAEDYEKVYTDIFQDELIK